MKMFPPCVMPVSVVRSLVVLSTPQTPVAPPHYRKTSEFSEVGHGPELLLHGEGFRAVVVLFLFLCHSAAPCLKPFLVEQIDLKHCPKLPLPMKYYGRSFLSRFGVSLSHDMSRTVGADWLDAYRGARLSPARTPSGEISFAGTQDDSLRRRWAFVLKNEKRTHPFRQVRYPSKRERGGGWNWLVLSLLCT